MYFITKYPNWRSAIKTLPSLATFLGGFSLSIMLLSLRADIKIINFSLNGFISISSHLLSLILLAIAVLMFIYSVQFLLHAGASNYFEINDELLERMKEEAKSLGGDIEKYAIQKDEICSTWYHRGTILFNIGLLFLLGGTAVVMIPYSLVVTILFSLGILVEIAWMAIDR